MCKFFMQTIMTLMAFLSIAACTSKPLDKASLQDLGPEAKTEGLPAQTLAQGKCGLFLWEEKQGRPLVFFQRAGSDIAQVYAGGHSFEAVRTSAEVEIIDGLFQRQKFTSGEKKLHLRLQTTSSRNVVEGIRIPKGVMSITGSSGDQSIISLSGLFGCKM